MTNNNVSNDSVDELAVLQNEMAPGEHLLWTAQPDPVRVAFRSMPIFVAGLTMELCALVWLLGTSGIWSAHSHLGPTPIGELLFPFFGAPILLAGVIMVMAPGFAYKGAQKTLYAVSDSRVLIVSQGLFHNLRSYTGPQISATVRRNRGNGYSDIIIVRQAHEDDRRTSDPVAFYAVRNAGEVEPLLHRLIRQSTVSTEPFGGEP